MSFVAAEIAKFRASPLLRNASWLLAGQGLGLLLQAVYFVILARLLGPLQYGIYAGAFAFASLLAQYSPLGTGTVFLRYVSSDHSAFAVYWGNILAVTLVVGGALTAALDLLGGRLLNPSSAALVLLAAISNCFFAQLTIESSRVFQTFEQMRFTAVLNLLTNLLRTVAAAAMLVTIHRATAWQWAFAAMLVSAIGAVVTVTTITIRFGRPRFSAELFAKRGLEGVGFSVAMSTTSLYNDLDKTMLSHYGMNQANGIYSMAYRIVDIATIPIFSMRDAALPRLFKLGASGLAGSADLSYRLLRRALPLAAIVSAAMFLAAPLIPHVVGPGFAESVMALRWLCLIPVLRSIHQMTGCALTGAGLQNYRTGTQFVAAATNFLLNLWLIPRCGWHGAAWSSLITDAALALMNWGVLQMQLKEAKTTMKTNSIFRRLREPAKTARAALLGFEMVWLMLRNRFGSSRVATGGQGPVVSLTTYGKRIHTVHLTIESVARGQVLPSRLILWLDDPALFAKLSQPLLRLQRRGLEIKLCRNYGPHTKYFPYVESQARFRSPLVTADDDVVYPSGWLAGLAAAHQSYPQFVNCYRARVAQLHDGTVAPYREWPLCSSVQPSYQAVATGVSGVIYPVRMLEELKRAGAEFESRCPKADDLWLHVQAMRAGFRVRQMQPAALHFPHIPGTQARTLWSENAAQGDGNDRQSAVTYEAGDLELLRNSTMAAHA
jgi:O-antigen/teichoic acid export membrane protein